jgi:hypothetical protein
MICDTMLFRLNVCAGGCVVMASTATAAFREDFESPFDSVSLSDGPWSTPGAAPGRQAMVVPGVEANTSQVIDLKGSSRFDDSALLSVPVENQLPQGFLECDLYLPTDKRMRLNIWDGKGSQTAVIYIGYFWGKKVDIGTDRVDGGEIAGNVMSYNKWAHWKVAWDIPKQVLTVEVDGRDAYPGDLSLDEAAGLCREIRVSQ